MLDALQATRKLLATAHVTSERARRKAGAFVFRFWWLAALVATALVDIVWPIHSALRGIFVVAWVVLGVQRWLGEIAAHQPDVQLERAASQLEARYPDLENALINAVQFSQAAALPQSTASRKLMETEIRRAESRATELSEAAALAKSPELNSARNLLVGLALSVLLILLIFPRIPRFEGPRLFLFWRDSPAFSLTDFETKPGDIRIKRSSSVEVMVKLSGQIPERVWLETRTVGTRWQSVPMLERESNTFAQTLEAISETTEYRIRANTGESSAFNILVDPSPAICSVDVVVTPPAYARKPPVRMKLDKTGISGLVNSSVQLEVEGSIPLASGKLVLESNEKAPEEIPLVAVPGSLRKLAAAFVIKRDAAFRIDLVGANGVPQEAATRGQIHLLRDERPLVSISAPGQNAVVSPTMEIPIRVEAEDDVAIRRIEFHRIVNNLADSTEQLPIPLNAKQASGDSKLNLKDLGLRPGDIIQYYATAYDNDPLKPNVVDSDRYWLWVVSQEEYDKMLRDQRGKDQMTSDYRSLAERLRVLAENQKRLADSMQSAHEKSSANPKDAQSKREMDALKMRQKELKTEAADLAAEMKRQAASPNQNDMEAGLKEKLKELARQLDTAASEMDRASSSKSADASKAAQSASSRLGKAASAMEKSIEKPLEALDKLAPLYDAMEELKEIASSQAEVALQSKEVAGRQSLDELGRAREAELSSKETEIRQRLLALQKTIQEAAELARTESPGAAQKATDLLQQLEKMDVAGTLFSASSAMAKPDAPEGARQAERAQRALESLMKEGEKTQSDCKNGLNGSCKSATGQGAGNTLGQMSNGRGRGKSGGRGHGSGSGTDSAPTPGSRPGDGSSGGVQKSAQPLTMMQKQKAAGSSNKRKKSAGGVGSLAGPTASDVERLDGSARPPITAVDGSSSRYPVEYRRLVNDYFKSVANGKSGPK